MSKQNENSPGYKKTKVGWIPEEWETVKLASCFKLASGETRPSDICELSNSQSSIPVYGGNGILGYTSTEFDDCKRIIIGRVGEKCGCVHLVEGPHFITDNALYTREWQRDSSIEYFAFYLHYFNLSKLRNKGGQPLVSQKPIYSVSMPLPPLPEQKKIAEILSAWVRAIEQVNKLITAKTKLKKALMQQFLTGKRRFKEFVKTSNKQMTRYGTIPADWDYPKVGKVAKEVSTRNKKGDNVAVLSCTKYDGLVESLKYFGRQVFSKDTSTYKVVKRGQFAYATNHIEEGSIGMLDFLDEGLVSPMYTVFQTGEKVYAPFLFKVFKTELYRHIFEVNTSASVNRRGSLRWHGFLLIHVPLPSFDEQEKISDCINAFDREIRLLEKKVDTLKEQKKGLMQKLLTGTIRVKE